MFTIMIGCAAVCIIQTVWQGGFGGWWLTGELNINKREITFSIKTIKNRNIFVVSCQWCPINSVPIDSVQLILFNESADGISQTVDGIWCIKENGKTHYQGGSKPIYWSIDRQSMLISDLSMIIHDDSRHDAIHTCWSTIHSFPITVNRSTKPGSQGFHSNNPKTLN